MSGHYYSKTPEVNHNRQTHADSLRGNPMKFVTDAGVFSKTGVDYGSRVLERRWNCKKGTVCLMWAAAMVLSD